MNSAIKVSFPIILTENLNLKALWEPTEYTITYIGVEGSKPNRRATTSKARPSHC